MAVSCTFPSAPESERKIDIMMMESENRLVAVFDFSTSDSLSGSCSERGPELDAGFCVAADGSSKIIWQPGSGFSEASQATLVKQLLFGTLGAKHYPGSCRKGSEDDG